MIFSETENKGVKIEPDLLGASEGQKGGAEQHPGVLHGHFTKYKFVPPHCSSSPKAQITFAHLCYSFCPQPSHLAPQVLCSVFTDSTQASLSCGLSWLMQLHGHTAKACVLGSWSPWTSFSMTFQFSQLPLICCLSGQRRCNKASSFPGGDLSLLMHGQ